MAPDGRDGGAECCRRDSAVARAGSALASGSAAAAAFSQAAPRALYETRDGWPLFRLAATAWCTLEPCIDDSGRPDWYQITTGSD